MLFDNHVNSLINFSKTFDSNLYLKVIEDEEHQNALKSIPSTKQTIKYLISDLWPKLGFLPIDDHNMDTALIAEFFLYEWVFRVSDSTDLENLDIS